MHTVLLVDDNSVFLKHLARFLADVPFLEVIGEARSGDDALTRIDALEPDLVLLDLSMPAGSGFDILPQIKTRAPQARVIVVTMSHSPHHRERASRLGADGFVPKDRLFDDLLPEIRRLLGLDEPDAPLS